MGAALTAAAADTACAGKAADTLCGVPPVAAFGSA
jgi:hypothetical protein